MASSKSFRWSVAAACAALSSSAALAQAATTVQPPPPTAEELYEQALSEGEWVTSQSLAIADLAYSFGLNINGMDDRESAAISAWHGVFQSDGVATVMYTIYGMEVVFGDDFTEEQTATCRHLNDGRWWCEARVASLKINAGFYLEKAPPPVEDPAAPVTPPPR